MSSRPRVREQVLCTCRYCDSVKPGGDMVPRSTRQYHIICPPAIPKEPRARSQHHRQQQHLEKTPQQISYERIIAAIQRKKYRAWANSYGTDPSPEEIARQEAETAKAAEEVFQRAAEDIEAEEDEDLNMEDEEDEENEEIQQFDLDLAQEAEKAAKKANIWRQFVHWYEGVPVKKVRELKHLLKTQFDITIPSMRRLNAKLRKTTGIEPKWYDCCINICMAYTREIDDQLFECRVCGEPRYFGGLMDHQKGRPRKQWLYFPLIPRLKYMYNTVQAEALIDYRHKFHYSDLDSNAELTDFFNARLYQDWHVKTLGMFKRATDIALLLTTDGAKMFKLGSYNNNPFIAINLNLPPKERSLMKNILYIFNIPGPNKPQDMDSFMVPMVKEFYILDEGIPDVQFYNKRSTFTLYAWPIAFAADGHGMSQIMKFNAPGVCKLGCRCCWKEGTRPYNEGSAYYPSHTEEELANGFRPRDYMREDYESFRTILNNPSETRTSIEETMKDYGFRGFPILLQVRSLHFPGSFPYDIMHMILLNILKEMHEWWGGTAVTEALKAIAVRKKKKDGSNPQSSSSSSSADELAAEIEAQLTLLAPVPDCRLSDKVWAILGGFMPGNKSTTPTMGFQAPRDIGKYWKSFKAKDWEAWLTIYGPVILRMVLRDKPEFEPFYDNFMKLREIWIAARSRRVSAADLHTLRLNCAVFVAQWENLYYGRPGFQDQSRLRACKINNHWLLHLADQIRDLGPAPGFWSFMIERYIGMMKGMITLRSDPDKQLGNSLERQQHLNLLEPLPLRDPSTLSNNSTTSYSQSYSYKNCSVTTMFSDAQLHRDDDLYKALHAFFGADELEIWPLDTAKGQVRRYKRANVRWKLSIGSEKSNSTDSDLRRQNHYIRWIDDGNKAHYESKMLVVRIDLIQNLIARWNLPAGPNGGMVHFLLNTVDYKDSLPTDDGEFDDTPDGTPEPEINE